jgi:hypothetical protein
MCELLFSAYFLLEIRQSTTTTLYFGPVETSTDDKGKNAQGEGIQVLREILSLISEISRNPAGILIFKKQIT